MKKQICTLALSTLFGLTAAIAAPLAQDQSTPPQSGQAEGRHLADPNRQIRMLSKRLNLTADQQNQILPILTERQQQMQSIWSDNSLSAKDRRAKMRAVREDSEAKLRSVLTDSQKQSYDQLQQQRRERMGQRRQNQSQS